MTLSAHGGDLALAEAEFGTPLRGWIDLSTGINPWPWDVDPGLCHTLFRLPGSRQISDLLRAARWNYRVPGSRGVVSAPGSQAVIQWLPRLRPAGNVAVLSPTYSEHALSWGHAGHRVENVISLQGLDSPDVVVVTRPNNPDGQIVQERELIDLALALGTRDGWLVVDEAFVDCCPADSLASVDLPNLVVIRSFGKFFGLPGLRLGFAVCDPSLAAALETALGPWAVSALAAEVGIRALDDLAWQERSRLRLRKAARRLDRALDEGGLQVTGGTSLFRLARSREAERLYRTLGQAGIHVRTFTEAPDLIRFGLPGSEEHWHRLEQVLAS